MVIVPQPAEPSLFLDLAWPKLRLFGPMRACWGDGRSFLPRTTKTKAVLAVLALADARPVSRRLLIDLLWPTRERAQAQASLRQSIHELRHYLAFLKGGCLISVRDELTLRVEHLWIDALFARTPEFSAPHMEDVFRGPLLGDLRGVSGPFDAWILAEQGKLSDEIRSKVASLFAKLPPCDETAKMAEAVLSYDTSHLAAWTALTESRIAAGDETAAMDVFHRYTLACRRPGGPSGFGADAVAARILSNAAASKSTLPVEIGKHASHPRRNPQRRSTFPVPWRAAYLAHSPTKSFGNASAEFALCIDWQIMSALSKFEDISCTPFNAVLQGDNCLQNLIADGFDFLLEGCIDRFGNQDRIILRLRDIHMKGVVFWSQQICRPASDAGLFGADFATLLAPQIAAEISKYQAMVLENCSDQQVDVTGLILRASRAVQQLDRHSLASANKLLAEAINRDSRHPTLLTWLAYLQLMQAGQGWLSDVAASHRRIGELVDRSIALNPDNATVLAIAGHVLAFTQNRLEEGLTLQENALSRNPNLPAAWLFSGLAHSYAGEHKEAISRLQRAKLLSPADQHLYFIEMGLSLSHLLDGQNDNALTASRNAIRLNPNFSSSFKIGVAASSPTVAGQCEPTLLQRLLSLEPGLTVERVMSRSPLTRPADKARLADGLRMAGLPR